MSPNIIFRVVHSCPLKSEQHGGYLLFAALFFTCSSVKIWKSTHTKRHVTNIIRLLRLFQNSKVICISSLTLLVRRKWLADFKIWEFFSVIYSPCLTTYFGQFAVIFMQLSWTQITMYKRKSTRFREFMKGWRWHIFQCWFSKCNCLFHSFSRFNIFCE